MPSLMTSSFEELDMKNRSLVLVALLSTTPLLTPVVKAQPDAKPQVAPQHNVEIGGEVLKPGTYDIGAAKTLSSLLALAGGATNNANLERVSIRREQPNITIDYTVNFAKLAGHTPKSQGDDFLLNDGDKIRVQALKPVCIMGNVARPGTYKLPNEGIPSVEKMVLLAGGIQGDGPMEIHIFRDQEPGEQLLIIAKNQTLVQPADTIFISPKKEKPKD